MTHNNLLFRQVHLDFHTHQSIEGIGADFDPDTFADTLSKARVNSINLFARGHHGYIYYDTKKFADQKHPFLTRNLLADQITACHKRGIKTPIYITVQWDAFLAWRRPEWLARRADQSVANSFDTAGFYNTLCLRSPYKDWLKEFVADVFENLPVDGFWFDIVLPQNCCCRHCVDAMLNQGLDPTDEKARKAFGVETTDSFKREMTEFVRTHSKDCSIFYNAGHVGPAQRPTLDAYTHLELESLPSGSWGYIHFPATVRYARNLGKDLLGMTGKFHTTWGDFHSFKNPEALQFECFNMLANNAKCCVGDQLHPRGNICRHTYELIGSVYKEVEVREPWCVNAEPVVDIGVFTPEEFTGGSGAIPKPVVGATRMLQELRCQFDILDSQSDLSAYKLLILPDEIPVNNSFAKKLQKHLDNGNALICTHRAGLNTDGNAFALPLGVDYIGDAEFTPVFVKPRAEFKSALRDTEHVMYITGSHVKAAPGSEILADNIAPYFNRTWKHYCSHNHAPSAGKEYGPSLVRQGRAVYCAQPLFAQYAANAPRWCRDILSGILELLLPNPVLRVNAPSSMIATVNRQKQENRDIIHLLHYIPQRNSDNMDTVDDVIPLHDIDISLRAEKEVRAITCVPEGTPLQYQQKSGRVSFTLPKLTGYQLLAVEYQ